MPASTFASARTACRSSSRRTRTRTSSARRISPTRRCTTASRTRSYCRSSSRSGAVIEPSGGRTELLLQVRVEPLEDFVVPLLAVRGLEDPVVLVREEEETALDAAPLQRREGREALGVRHAIVERAVDHEHRRLPGRHEVRRVRFLVALGIL